MVCQGYISTIMIHNKINAMFLVFIVTYKIKYNIVNMCLYAIYILVLLTYKFIECNKMYTICCLFSEPLSLVFRYKWCSSIRNALYVKYVPQSASLS